MVTMGNPTCFSSQTHHLPTKEFPHNWSGDEKHGSQVAENHGIDWIGLREILQETIDFPMKYGAFL